jgi:NAD(P)-dependent dehydrogenase (short-subunit alcohol dehydrogenase family)
VTTGLTDAGVLVVGGASHIGRAIVHGFAREHARIVIVDLDEERAEATAAEAEVLGSERPAVFKADVTDHAQTVHACTLAEAALKGVDVLITNVGGHQPNFFLDYPPEQWSHVINLNLTSAMSCVSAVLPGMVARRRGAIVSTISTANFGEPRQSVYGAAKAGVVAFMRTIALEYGRYGIRANMVSPGLVLPENNEGLGSHSVWHRQDAIMSDQQVAYVVRNTPLQRLSTPEDIADSVLFLASEKARQLTGQHIVVSGGFAMR